GDSVRLSVSGGMGSATFTWNPTTGLTPSSGSDVIARPTQTTLYVVNVYEGGCSGSDSILITVAPSPIANFAHSGGGNCEGQTVSFEDRTQNATFLAWDFGDGSSVSNERNPVHFYSRPGVYIVRLTATNGFGCRTITESTQAITVNGGIVADFTSNPAAGSGLIVLPDARVEFTNLTVGAVRYFWNFGDGFTSSEENPVHVYESPGSYKVVLLVENGHGCADTAAKWYYTVVEPALDIPNVFTPNGDGVNDVFKANYTGTGTVEMLIFDRWGIQLFETKDKIKGWDGTHAGKPAPDGIYYYVIQVDGKKYYGNVTLLR
ncbi:MAG: PKD domain-containing protein, partial [Bacteroidia bacterium]|nr:PKD domain-containing protein [Bacteroidia bacterium]